jgi:hypothetical protein
MGGGTSTGEEVAVGADGDGAEPTPSHSAKTGHSALALIVFLLTSEWLLRKRKDLLGWWASSHSFLLEMSSCW